MQHDNDHLFVAAIYRLELPAFFSQAATNVVFSMVAPGPLAATGNKSRTYAVLLAEEELTAANAGQDMEVVAAARSLIEMIQRHAPGAAAAVGVDLKDVSAANLRLADIAAAGTGVKVEHGTFTGDIDIKGVRAGLTPGEPSKGG